MRATIFRRLFADIATHPFLTLLTVVLIPVALQHFIVLCLSTNYPIICEKDYIQDYAMIAALREGADPYAPIPVLVERFVPQCKHVPLNMHPSPHPISMAALTSPLAGIISYRASYALWGLIEGCALLFAIFFLARIPAQKPSVADVLLGFMVTVSAFTTYDDIFLGQVNFVLLALFAAGISKLKKHEVQAGLLFGAAIAIKFFGWPLALVLILKRRWKTSVALAGGFAIVQALSVAIAGLDTTTRYYREVVPEMSNFYAACGLNQSLRTLPQHLFVGYSEHCYNWPDDGALAVPFFDSPALMHATALALPLLISLCALFLAWRTRSLEDSLVSILCFSVIASPVVWGHAGVLTYIVIASLFLHWRRLVRSPLAISLLVLWAAGVFVIPTFVPGSPNRDLLAALHNTSVSLAALSAASLALWLAHLHGAHTQQFPQK